MQITVRYFAALREARGCDEEALAVSEGTDVAALYQQIFSDSPLAVLRVMFAVNQSYVGANHGLVDGDEVAFIPPLGGG
ncbi:MAG: molybdopterin converting factor subunit 1 [Myxococcota bacterium]|nr:molybdopterin converting factor subunit 1 [Myxococcota bacterium]